MLAEQLDVGTAPRRLLGQFAEVKLPNINIEAGTDGIVIVSYRCQVCNYMILYFYRYEM